MDGGIVNLDDLTVGFNGVGDIDRLFESADQSLGDGSLAVAGGAVNQYGSSGVGRWPEPADDILRTAPRCDIAFFSFSMPITSLVMVCFCT